MAKSNVLKFRDEWLINAITKLRPSFDDVNLPLPPKIRASTGLPAGGVSSTARGQTWDAGASRGGYYEIFIRPELADDMVVLTQLVAQLISTVVPPVAIGFSPEYKSAMSLVGLAGKTWSALRLSAAANPIKRVSRSSRALPARRNRYPVACPTSPKTPQWKEEGKNKATCRQMSHVRLGYLAGTSISRGRSAEMSS